MRAGRFDLAALNSVKDSSDLDKAKSLSLGMHLFSVDVISASDLPFSLHLLQSLLCWDESMLRVRQS